MFLKVIKIFGKADKCLRKVLRNTLLKLDADVVFFCVAVIFQSHKVCLILPSLDHSLVLDMS